jgi:stage II sporulation protein M
MRIRYALIAALALFIIGFIGGLYPPRFIAELMQGSLANLQRLAQTIQPYQITTVFILFFNNALALITGFVFSPLLCIAPALSLLANGWALGYIGSLAAEQVSPLYVVLGLLPHGIFEIPAFILGQAAAISMGSLLIWSIFNREKRTQLLPGFRRNGIIFAISLGLLIPAAFIETYLTPLLIGR